MGAGSDGQRDAFFREQVGFIAIPFARIASHRVVNVRGCFR